jgi:hypothetical protein
MRNPTDYALLVLIFVAGCSSSLGSLTLFTGAGEDDLLKLHADPGLGFRVILTLPDGTQLIRRGCIMESSQLWCRVA